jgi:hypothetical protein
MLEGEKLCGVKDAAVAGVLGSQRPVGNGKACSREQLDSQ